MVGLCHSTGVVTQRARRAERSAVRDERRGPLRARPLGVPLWVWLVAVAVSLLLLGPALLPGALMNLDLLVFDRLPVPRGMWGLGPELPRRVPFWAGVAWLGSLVGADTAAKATLLILLVMSFVGSFRVTVRTLRDSGSRTVGSLPVELVALGGGMLYAAGPFVLTRAAIGHWPVVLVAAVLPWALPDLVELPRSQRRLGAWALLFSLGGVYGGIVGGAFLISGLRKAPPSRRLRAIGVWMAAQLVWLVPLFLVTVTTPGRSMPSSSAFATPMDSVGDLGRLLAGLGFWNPGFQLAREQAGLAAVGGFLVVAFAVVGTKDLPRSMRGPLVAVGLAGLALALASSVPLLDDILSAFTNSALGAPFRESQRYLLPFLLWAAVASPRGAQRMASRLPAALGAPLSLVPWVFALLLIAPSAWGLEGQLRTTTPPTEWVEARQTIEAERGSVLSLPWYQYFTADAADNRLVLSPLPLYLGGDVINASDPQLSDEPAKEVGDGRESEAARIVEELRNGRPASIAMAGLGIRWVARLHDVDWRDYTGLDDDPGLEVAVDGDSLTLYRVRNWPGEIVDDTGRDVSGSSVVRPFWTVEPSGPAAFSAPYQSGWLRGFSVASSTEDGRVRLPSGSGPVWYWPSLLVLAAYAAWVGILIWSVIPTLRRWGRAVRSSRRA